ncbi:MAG: nucleoside monophosphate kinase [Bacilli bacterium]|nr:nucleoside monophosphate kinase [Bacilli bacterium]MDD4282530.1 nucleoside monophosphate kinase [Bacilli bacterium]MDD4718291.1 nucleoside monophosphate kinase [Bacilli bacterium]
MKNIIFISPPAAGKGTQSQMISEKYNIPHISMGSILRNEIKNFSEIGKRIKEEMTLGSLIEDSTIVELLIKRISNKDCEKGYILDGFPRNINQAYIYDKLLDKDNKKIDYIFYLNLDKEEAYKRIIGRLTCNDCQTVYNDMFENTKPKKIGICDKCNGLLIKRKDDSVKIFEKRYQTYLEETEPLIDYYRHQNNYYEIDSGLSKEYTFKQITNIIDNGDLND